MNETTTTPRHPAALLPPAPRADTSRVAEAIYARLYGDAPCLPFRVVKLREIAAWLSEEEDGGGMVTLERLTARWRWRDFGVDGLGS